MENIIESFKKFFLTFNRKSVLNIPYKSGTKEYQKEYWKLKHGENNKPSQKYEDKKEKNILEIGKEIVTPKYPGDEEVKKCSQKLLNLTKKDIDSYEKENFKKTDPEDLKKLGDPKFGIRGFLKDDFTGKLRKEKITPEIQKIYIPAERARSSDTKDALTMYREEKDNESSRVGKGEAGGGTYVSLDEYWDFEKGANPTSSTYAKVKKNGMVMKLGIAKDIKVANSKFLENIAREIEKHPESEIYKRWDGNISTYAQYLGYDAIQSQLSNEWVNILNKKKLILIGAINV